MNRGSLAVEVIPRVPGYSPNGLHAPLPDLLHQEVSRSLGQPNTGDGRQVIAGLRGVAGLGLGRTRHGQCHADERQERSINNAMARDDSSPNRPSKVLSMMTLCRLAMFSTCSPSKQTDGFARITGTYRTSREQAWTHPSSDPDDTGTTYNVLPE